MKGPLLSHLGEILFQELQHVVHGALAVLSGGDTYHSLTMNSHVTRLHAELGRTDGIPHRLGIHLQGGRGCGGEGRNFQDVTDGYGAYDSSVSQTFFITAPLRSLFSHFFLNLSLYHEILILEMFLFM